MKGTKIALSDGLVQAILGTLTGASVFVVGLVLLPILSILSSAPPAESQIDATFAYTALALAVVGLCILFIGATKILIDRSPTETKNEVLTSTLSTLSRIFSKRSYSRVLVLSSVVYAIFYALASGIIVYNPNVNFSIIYHVSIPSSTVATCCAPLGQTPLAVLYLTEHLGVLLVPANLLLLFSISWLVGLNVALAAFAFSLRNKRRGIGWFAGIGATLGLFTSCPTCAGLALLSVLGGTGTLSVAFFLGPLQTFFVAVSLPMLVATPVMLARSIRSFEARVCRL